MKRLSLCLCSLWLILLFLPVRVYGWPIDEVLRKKVTLRVQNATVDEYLVELGRLAEINIIADAARFSVSYPPVSGEFQLPVWGLIVPFATQRKLSATRYDSQTFLLWSEPDVASIARELVKKMADPVEIEPDEKLSAYQKRLQSRREGLAANQVLTEYFQRVHNWDGRRTNIGVALKLSDLPPDVRRIIWREARRRILHGPDSSTRIPTTLRIWYDDNFWKRAVLQVTGPVPPGVDPALAIRVGGLVEEDEYRVSTISCSVAEPYAGSTSGGREKKQFITREPAMLESKTVEDGVAEAATGAVESAPAVSGARPQRSAGLSIEELSRDDALQRPVSLQARRQPLSEALQDVQKQSGVALAIDAAVPAVTMRVTAWVKEMPLHTLMGALRRLYGVEWIKGDGGYVMRLSEDELDRNLLQVGDMSPYMNSQKFDERWQQAAEFAGQFLDVIDLDTLMAKPEDNGLTGVPVSTLPAELQIKLRRHVEAALAPAVMRDYVQDREKLERLSDECILHVGTPPGSVKPIKIGNRIITPTAPKPQMKLLAPDGRTLAYFGPTGIFGMRLMPWPLR
ncbi:MAG: hypothetical protein JWN98_209 [Abditibacteriota bacterium]|nr:hypothetical protein [Abditibacteriota bacterium]